MFVLLWRETNGNCWESLNREDIKAFLQDLIEHKGIDPATVRIIGPAASVRWMFPLLHKTSTPLPQQNQRFKMEKQAAGGKLGWIAPDGRFFACGYGGHSEKARCIVGALEPVEDASVYLEEKGWAAILKNPLPGRPYLIGMGKGQRLNQQQAKTLLDILPMETIEKQGGDELW